MSIKVFLCGVFLTVAAVAHSQEAIIEPSFGIKWNDTIETVLARYPDAEIEEVESLTRVTIDGPASDSSPSDTDFTILLFAKKLWLS